MSAPQSNRRDFLKGKAAARAGEHLIDGLVETSEDLPAPSSGPRYLIKYSQKAMACQFEVWLNVGQYPQGPETALAAFDLIQQIEDQLTVYRSTSEVSALNRCAAQSPVVVDEALLNLLSQSVELWKATHGAFDITAGPLSQLWGFTRRAGQLPEATAIAETLARVGSQHLRLDLAAQTVAFDCPGIEINLGGIGKGYALDRCTTLFEDAEISDYLLHGGSSSVCARGNCSSRKEGGWSIGVRNPLRPREYLGEIILRDRSLSTSSAAAQQFVHQGKSYGHILDPRTGWPAEGVLSATVIANSAAEAEALSTAFYVEGLPAATTYCAANPTIGCLLICPDDRKQRAICHTLNLNEADWLPR